MKRLNIRIGRISRVLFPGYSSCKCCKTTWNIVNPVDVLYTNTRGCFTLCEKCWNESDTDKRIAYYVSEFQNRLNNEQIQTMKYNIEGMD